MQANIGDRIRMQGRTAGMADRSGEIVEIHGDGGAPPYRVRFEDGHEGLMYPGPDAVIEPQRT